MNASELLSSARGLIRARGLAFGEYVDGEGRVCAIGAMRIASGLSRNLHEHMAFANDETYSRASAYLWRGICGFDTISEWSDGSSQEQVIQGFTRAATKARVDLVLPAS